MMGVTLAALTGLLLLSGTTWAADKVTLTGQVTVTEDDDFNVTDVTLKGTDGKTYSVTLDEKGKKLGIEMDGAKVQVVGTVAEKGGKMWLTVMSYKEIIENDGDFE
jgi:hypothetical protein